MTIDNIEIITTCTKKKLATPVAYIKHDAIFDSQGDMLEHWKAQLAACPEHKKIPASQLYRGRGFKRILKIVSEDVSKVHVMSAGLGLVGAADKLVPYNLTTSVGSNSHVKNHLPTSRFDETDWWDGIAAQKLHDLIESKPNTIFILSCSRSYLEMVMNDLLMTQTDHRQRIRIVGNELEQVSDFELFDYIMPYDLRLNSVDSPYRGGKIDFAQRAAHHLYDIVKANMQATAVEHQQMVFKSMESYGSLEDVKQSESIANEDLRELLIKEWKSAFGRPSRLLQLVRQKHGFSCSESRLNGVVKEIKEDIARGVDLFDDEEVEEA